MQNIRQIIFSTKMKQGENEVVMIQETMITKEELSALVRAIVSEMGGARHWGAELGK